MVLAALGLGLLVGVIIGALGGGGSILTVPLLVFALGLSAQEATSASLVIVGITAVVASVSHARSGHTRWRTGLLLVAAGVPASILGTRLNRLVEENVLLLTFAALMLVAATGMLLRAGHQHDDETHDNRSPDAPPDPIDRGGAATTARPVETASATGRRVALRLIAAGLLIGFLTGFLGVGGGFVAVPVLVIALSLPMPAAVGTSLLVIALNSGVALAARAGQDTFAWDVIVPFTLTAVAGSLLGKRVGDRVNATALTRGFAALLVLVALYVAARAGLALT
jgi:uncharacterized membrane protein YfcA